jgi:hypothetical protein
MVVPMSVVAPAVPIAAASGMIARPARPDRPTAARQCLARLMAGAKVGELSVVWAVTISYR